MGIELNHAIGLTINPHAYSRSITTRELENETVFQLRFVNAHLLLDLNENPNSIYSHCTMTMNELSALSCKTCFSQSTAHVHCSIVYSCLPDITVDKLSCA